MNEAIPLRPSMDDRIIEVVRNCARNTAKHVVFASRGTLKNCQITALCENLPHPFSSRLAKAPDALELFDDHDEAQNMLVKIQIALEQSPLGFGAHALFARRDGTVDLVQRGYARTIRTELFPGFADIAA